MVMTTHKRKKPQRMVTQQVIDAEKKVDADEIMKEIDKEVGMMQVLENMKVENQQMIDRDRVVWKMCIAETIDGDRAMKKMGIAQKINVDRTM